MKKIKINKLIVSIITCAILLIMQSNIVFGATKEEVAYIMEQWQEWIDTNYPGYFDKNFDGGSTETLEIAKKLRQLCDEKNITVEECQSIAVNDLGITGATTYGTPLYMVINTAKKIDVTDNTSADEKQANREALEKQIKEAMVDYTSKSTKELKEIDALFKEYKENYPSSWYKTNPNKIYILAEDLNDELISREDLGDYTTAMGETRQEREEETNYINNNNNNEPSTAVLGSSPASGSHTPDEVINEAKDFIGKAEGNKISASNLKDASNTLYNILLAIGVFLAVAIGMYLGIKFMLSSAEDKAKVKEALIPYIAGCVVIFGAFVIWKLAITLLSGIA